MRASAVLRLWLRHNLSDVVADLSAYKFGLPFTGERFTLRVREPAPQSQANTLAIRANADLRLSIEVAKEMRK